MVLVIATLLSRLVLCAIFLVAGLTKLTAPDSTREMLAGFGVRSGVLTVLALALPPVELGIAVALILPPTAYAGALSAFALLALFTGVIGFNLMRGRQPYCNCFGQISSAPVNSLTLVRNVLLTGLALLVVVAGPDMATTRMNEAFGISEQAALAWAGGAILFVTLLFIAVAQVAILRRLSGLHEGHARGGQAHSGPAESGGLPEGTPAPSFGLMDTRGKFVTLEELLAPGHPLILYFSKPDCPPCAALADEVGRWQRNYAGLFDITRISDRAAEGDEYALLQADNEVARAYDCWGTPCAVLVTREGRIGSSAAQGASAIRGLVRRVAASAMKVDVKAV